ncbi:MAG: HEAT repeat domain-containing protein [Pseudonocardiaceae bacterium]
MAVTNEQVKAVLDRDEPDYEEAAAQLGPEALPLLQRFVAGGDPNLAAKAAYLAGRIGDPEAAPILELAAGSADPGIRAAAASGAQHIGMAAESVLLTLLDDDDPAVRKTALRATPPQPSEDLVAKLRVLRDVEPEPMVREMAAEAFDNVSGGGASP